MANRKGGGAKLNRTEIVYVRLDPMMHRGAQLAAARERRTLSSFIECAVEERLKVISSGRPGHSIWDVMEEIWDPKPAIRFANLAFAYPHLLSHSEQLLWETVCDSKFFWVYYEGRNQTDYWYCEPRYLLVDRLVEKWSTLLQIVDGEEDEATLPEFEPSSAQSKERRFIPVKLMSSLEDPPSAEERRAMARQPVFSGSPELGIHPDELDERQSGPSDRPGRRRGAEAEHSPNGSGTSNPLSAGEQTGRLIHARSARIGKSVPGSSTNDPTKKKKGR